MHPTLDDTTTEAQIVPAPDILSIAEVMVQIYLVTDDGVNGYEFYPVTIDDNPNGIMEMKLTAVGAKVTRLTAVEPFDGFDPATGTTLLEI